MVAVTEDLETIFNAVNDFNAATKRENPITTVVVTERDGEKGKEREYEITFKAGLEVAYKQELENSYNAPAVMGANDPVVQSLNEQFYADTPPAPLTPPVPEVSEITAQAAALDTITDTLDVHLQHTEQAATGMAAQASLPNQTLEQLAATAPVAPQIHVAEGLEVQVVQQINQPPVMAVSFDPATANLEKIEAQLQGFVDAGAIDVKVADVMAQIKQQYPELVKTGDIALAPSVPAEAQVNHSIETPDVRRRPQEAAQASEQMMPMALPQISAAQYEGIAAKAQPQISTSDISTIAR